MPAPQMIPLSKITPGENPRGEIDESADSFKELCASIAARGVLQSILVGPANGNGKHKVIAGHRRFVAASKVKLKEMPAMVTDAGGAELTLALIENVQREDLTPVAEARALRQLREGHGFTQEQAAEALNKSVRWARDRERLVDLPEKAQEAFDAGAIPLEGAIEIQRIAEKAPRAAEVLATRALEEKSEESADDDGPGIRRNLADKRDLVKAIDEAIEHGEGEHSAAAHLFEVAHTISLPELELAGLSKEQLDPLKKGYAELEKIYKWSSVHWTSEALGEARAYGCLLEIESEDAYGHAITSRYITDRDWLAEHVKPLLEAAIEEAKSRHGRSEPAKKPEKGSDAEKRAKAKKRKEREAELERRDQVRALNLELGQRTEKAMRGVKLSLEEEKLLALMAVGDSASEIGGRGLIYCYHDYQEEERLKNGRAKVTYAAGRAAGEDLIRAILTAKKPGEPLAIALRGLLLAANADQSCVAESSRTWWSVPGAGAPDEVRKLLAKIVDDREVLPDSIRQERAEKQRERAEKAELVLLLAVKGSRAKEGIKHDQLLAESRAITAAAVDDAVDRKWVKAHEAGELSYTITDAGKKRLEKLGAAQKQRSGAAQSGSRAERALELIKASPGVETAVLAKEMKVKPNYLYRVLGDLEKEGKISKDGRKYTAVDAG